MFYITVQKYKKACTQSCIYFHLSTLFYFSLLLCNSNTCKRGNSSQPFTKIMKWPKYEHNTQRYYYSTSKYTYIITFIWLAPVIILIVMTLAGLYIITRALSWSTNYNMCSPGAIVLNYKNTKLRHITQI